MKKSLLFVFSLFSLTSFGQDGVLDNTFGTSGKSYSAYTSDFGSWMPVAVQSDGKILQATASPTGQTVVLRYNNNGGLDASFGTSGRFTASFTGFNAAQGIAIQSDGKIVLAGLIDSAGASHGLVMRLNTNGTLDAGFGNNGRKIIAFTGQESGFFSVAIQQDGKIVAAGYITDAAGSFANMAIARLTTAGQLDTSFDTDGRQTTILGGLIDAIFDLAIQSDGKIVGSGLTINTGSFGAEMAVVRYTTAGALDNTFGTNGKFSTSFGGADAQSYSVAIQPDGKIVASGSTDNGSNLDFALIRLTTAGVLDNTFGTGGRVTTVVGTDDDEAYSLGVQQDGKIVAGGDIYVPSQSGYDIAVVRYTSTGALDNTFGTAGKTIVDMNAGSDDEYGMVVSQGTKIIAGVTHYDASGNEIAALIRLNNSSAFYEPQACSVTAPVITAGGATTVCQGTNVVLTSNVATGIQWYNNGTAISGATGVTYTATQSGSYTAVATTTCSSSPSNAIVVTVNSIPVTPTITIAGNTLTSSSASNNQWYLNNVAIAGATNQTYVATASGSYTVKVTTNGCTSASSNAITYTLTGLNSPALDVKIRMAPNPVSNKMIISYTGTGKLTVEVLDLSGRNVLNRQSFTASQELDFSGYANGTYIVRIVNEKTSEAVQRLVVKQ